MLRVTVEYLPFLAEITGRRSEMVEVAEPTLKSLLVVLDSRYGQRWQDVFWEKKGEAISPHIMVVVDGHLVRELSAPLPAGAKVAITPAISGG